MKIGIRIIGLVIALVFFIYPQNSLTPSNSAVYFGSRQIHKVAGIVAGVENQGNQAVNITKITLTDNHFTTDLSPATVAGSDSRTFYIYFNPETNIDYYGTMIIEYENMAEPALIELNGTGDLGMSYYSGTTNLWGSELKTALHNIIKGHTQLSYTGLWSALQDTDEDTLDASKVILLYTGWTYDENNHGGTVSQWNREHVWAKAHGDFDTTPPEGTDLHHIRPTDVTVNSRRGNLDFDNGGSLYVDGDEATGCYVDGDSWEPRDEVKGDVARMMYYMVVRYEGDDTSHDLELVENIPSGLSSPDGYFGKQSTLYQWHWQDPVNSWERRRNDRIYTNWQHNRNPFIDHPEFADRMPSISGQPLTKDNPQLLLSPSAFNLTVSPSHLPLAIRPVFVNSGGGQVQISSIASNNPDFSPAVTSFTVSNQSVEFLSISFNNAAAGTYSTMITGQTDWSGQSTFTIPVSVTVTDATAIGDKENRLRTPLIVKPNIPNPFNPQTRLQVISNANRHAQLTVFNALGQQVLNQTVQLTVGENTLTVNGSNWSSGLYYYRVQSGQYRAAGKMMLLK